MSIQSVITMSATVTSNSEENALDDVGMIIAMLKTIFLPQNMPDDAPPTTLNDISVSVAGGKPIRVVAELMSEPPSGTVH